MRHLFVGFVVFVFILGAVGPNSVSADGATTQTFDASNLTSLNLTVSNGNVVVSAWDQPSVSIQTDSSDGVAWFEQQGATLTGTVSNPAVDTLVQVPRALAVTLNDANGTISVTGVQGALTLSSSNGDISAQADHSSQAISAQASDGNVSLSGFSGGGQIIASNGSVILAVPGDVGAQVDLASANGQIVVPSGSSVTSTDPSHETGTVRGGGSLFTIQTSNGSITVQ